MMKSMNDYRDIIALGMIKGVGPNIAKNLISALGSADEVFRASRTDFLAIPGIGETLADSILTARSSALNQAARELELMDRYAISPLSIFDSAYSKRLSVLDSSPVVLFLKGQTNMNSLKVLSVIGTRRPTDYGRNLCTEIISDLASRHKNLLIVSGLAYGIDITAHRAAVHSGAPTAAVLAHGLDILYPSQHADTARQIIADGGCLISEYPVGTQPDAPNFVARNRIVAAMADATLVVESGAKGGSLITANDAFTLGRDVLAIPGSPADEMSRGCNALIRDQKASLVMSAEDIEKRLGWTVQSSEPKTVQGSLFDDVAVSPSEQRIYDLLMVQNALSASDISQATGLPVNQVNTLLLQMEFSGKVKTSPGNIYKLVK